jgi:hypothetical protein
VKIKIRQADKTAQNSDLHENGPIYFHHESTLTLTEQINVSVPVTGTLCVKLWTVIPVEFDLTENVKKGCTSEEIPFLKSSIHSQDTYLDRKH